MDNLHSETLDFLVRALKAKQVEWETAECFAERKALHAEVESLKQRITLEFSYQLNRKGTGDSQP
jgi:hypothetical protein